MVIAILEGDLHSVADLPSRRLPGSQTDTRHLSPRVEGKDLPASTVNLGTRTAGSSDTYLVPAPEAEVVIFAVWRSILWAGIRCLEDVHSFERRNDRTADMRSKSRSKETERKKTSE